VKLDGNLGKGTYLLTLFPYYNTPNPHYHTLLFSIVTQKTYWHTMTFLIFTQEHWFLLGIMCPMVKSWCACQSVAIRFFSMQWGVQQKHVTNGKLWIEITLIRLAITCVSDIKMGHASPFRHLCSKSFPMIEGTLWPLQLPFQDLGVHWDSIFESGSCLGSVRVQSFTLSYTPRNMRCDFWASSWPTTLQAPLPWLQAQG
jgi:hypothetical protein